MESILFNYFFGKIIGIILIVVLIHLYRSKKISLIIFILAALFFVVINVVQYLSPNIFSNIRTYNTFSKLQANEVDKVKIYNDKKVLFTLNKNDRIEIILNSFKKNKFYYGNEQIRLEEYYLEFYLKKKTKIRFRIVETENVGTLIYLQNIFRDEYYDIGTFQNKKVSYLYQ